MDFYEVGLGRVLDSSGSGQGQALVSAVMNLWVPSNAGNF
jgi:hypothetical protein